MIPLDRVAHARGSAFPSVRALRTIRAAIGRYGLDLTGLTVLTEAATGYYRVTPVIAALAGAEQVLAVARDSSYGSTDEAREQVDDLASAAGVSDRVRVTTEAARSLCERAQVITNLGAVRPIDADFVARLPPDAVVSLMFGAVDARSADLDVGALRDAGVPLCGVDEAGIDLFRWTGQRLLWWLTEVGLEVAGARLVVWGDTAQARAVTRFLEGAGATVRKIVAPPADDELAGVDGLVLMDRAAVVGPGGALIPERLASAAPGAAILEYAGSAERKRCAAAGLIVYPLSPPLRGHVARTIGEILYAPVIELHAAGLRVGELMARARARGLDSLACEQLACDVGPGELVPYRE